MLLHKIEHHNAQQGLARKAKQKYINNERWKGTSSTSILTIYSILKDENLIWCNFFEIYDKKLLFDKPAFAKKPF